ncbi:MAG: DsbA family protein [Chloroflexi bacterium OHK40]
MRRFAIALLLVTMLLAACGAPAPASPTRSAIEERQTAVALEGRPTLAPLPSSPAGPPAPRPTSPALRELLALRADDPRALGRPDAPVTLIEFTDFECPFCQRFFRETRPQIIEQFVEAGVVRFVARDLPITEVHPAALVAAVAGRCAAAQGQFWPMYERLFATHGVVWGGAAERDSAMFADFAAELGLDQAAFVACQNDPAVERAVRDEADLVMRAGITVTPSFLVNATPLRGALPFRVFEDVIQQEAGR